MQFRGVVNETVDGLFRPGYDSRLLRQSILRERNDEISTVVKVGMIVSDICRL